MNRPICICLLTCFVLISPLLNGQVINTEKSRKETKEGLQGSLSLGFMYSQTTTEILHLQNDIGIQYTRNRHTLLALNNLELMRVSSTVAANQDLINQYFQHLRYNYSFRDTSAMIWEMFGQHQQNKMKYQNIRVLAGTGPRFRLVENDRVTLFLCPLIMYEFEEELETEATTEVSKVLKGDLYALLIYRFQENVSFTHVTYYQPALYDFTGSANFEPMRDFRVSSDTGLSVTFWDKKLEFSTFFQISHDSRPPGLFITEAGKDRMTFFMVRNVLRLNFN